MAYRRYYRRRSTGQYRRSGYSSYRYRRSTARRRYAPSRRVRAYSGTRFRTRTYRVGGRRY